MQKYIVLLLWLCGALGLNAQVEFRGEPLSRAVNSEYDESVPRLSPDGNTLYFVRAQHPLNVRGRGGGQDIWVSKKGEDGEWQPAVNAGANLNNELHNFVGGVGYQALLLGNCYTEKMPGISQSELKNGTWQYPRSRILLEGKEYGTLSFYTGPDFRVLLISMASGVITEDLYVAFMDQSGNYSEPKSLGAEINTTGHETAPFLSADTETLFFTSDGLSDHRGNGDIYMSRRLDDTWTNWSEPVNLGPEVNTPGYDGWFNILPGGKKAYFISGELPKSMGDIYEISLEDIPTLNPPPLVDTLRIATRQGQPLGLSFVRFGVPDDLAPLTTARSLNGKGEILRTSVAPYFQYRPAPGFSGKEMLELVHCDPPHSDDCQRIVVMASVEAVERVPIPEIRFRTQQGTPVALVLKRTIQDRFDLQRSSTLNRAAHGNLRWNRETEGEHIRYTPEPGFVGVDTLNLVGMCEDMNPRNCIMARVLVEVSAAAVVVTPDPVPLPPVAEDLFLHGSVIVEGNRELPEEIEMELYNDDNNQKWGTLTPKSDGSYDIRLPKGRNYRIEVSSAFYEPLEITVPGEQNDVERNLILTPLQVEAGQTIVLKNIYFDIGKSRLLPESNKELNRMYQLLRSNPEMEIEVRGHTDSQSDEEFNQQLSEDRVFSVINYLKYQGVMGYRLKGKGLGETQPVATNETPEGRAENRRVEFFILKK